MFCLYLFYGFIFVDISASSSVSLFIELLLCVHSVDCYSNVDREGVQMC